MAQTRRVVSIALCALVALGSTLVSLPASQAASSDYSGALGDVMELIEREDDTGAIRALERRLDEVPDDADALNLLGYSHRTSGNEARALEYYRKALALEPEHRGANEYLGRLYLEMDDLDQAGERLKALDSACFFGCEEHDELEAIESYRRRKSLD